MRASSVAGSRDGPIRSESPAMLGSVIVTGPDCDLGAAPVKVPSPRRRRARGPSATLGAWRRRRPARSASRSAGSWSGSTSRSSGRRRRPTSWSPRAIGWHPSRRRAAGRCGSGMPGDADGTTASPATTADGDDVLRLAAPGVEVDRRSRGRRADRVARRSMVASCSRAPATARCHGARSRWRPTPAASATRRSRSGTAPTAAGAACRPTRSTGPSSTAAGGAIDERRSRPSSGRTGRSPGSSASASSSRPTT